MTETTDSMRQLIMAYIGNKCIVCDAIYNIHFHQRYGRNHPNNLNYIFKHKGEFIPLCGDCHRQLHGLRKLLGKYHDINYDKIFDLAWEICFEPKSPNLRVSNRQLRQLSKEMETAALSRTKDAEELIPSTS